VRLIYNWPVVVPLVQRFFTDPSSTTRSVVATIAFRNEPFK